jgi:hypothetical protein
MFLLAAWKDFAITATAAAGGDTWTEITEFADGALATGNGTGSMKVGCWYKDHDGSESNPTLTFSTTVGLLASAAIVVFQKGASDTWGTPAFRTGAVASSSNPLAVASSSVDVPSGALVLALMGIRDDSATFTLDDLDDDQPTVWNGAAVAYPTTRFSTTTGNDMACHAGYRLVTTGSAGATLNMLATLSAAETGSALWVVQGVSSSGGTTNAPAGNAAATGASNNPRASIAPQLSAVITGTGAGHNVSATIAPTASAATGTGAALGAGGTVTFTAEAATGTGAAYDATANTATATDAQAEVATGAGAAASASLSISPIAAAATGTGAAYTASVISSVPNGLAAGTGAALNPSISINVSATTATGAGTAYTISATVVPTVSAATGAGAAFDATVSTSTATTASAGAATGTGAAGGPSASIFVSAVAASGTGAAANASVTTSGGAVSVNAEVATGTGQAFNASVLGPSAGGGSLHRRAIAVRNLRLEQLLREDEEILVVI